MLKAESLLTVESNRELLTNLISAGKPVLQASDRREQIGPCRIFKTAEYEFKYTSSTLEWRKSKSEELYCGKENHEARGFRPATREQLAC